MLVSLPPGRSGLFTGASASVAIVTQQVADVVTVPSSAVHTVGSNSFVSEQRGGRVLLTRVAVGAVNDALTQVTSGVAVGDTVVLANLNTPLPSSNTTNRGLAGAGGFGGSGFRGGGGGGG